MNDADILTLVQAVEENLAILERLIEEGKPSSAQSQDADRFNSKTLADWMAQVTQLVASHAQSATAHAVTATQLGGYTKVMAEAIAQQKISLGRLPLSFWGKHDGNSVGVSGNNPTLVITFPDKVPAFIAGRYYEMPLTQVSMASVQNPPANTTFNVYLVVENALAKYRISVQPLTTGPNVMFLGKIVVGGSSFGTILNASVVRLGKYQVTATPSGSSIPVSTSGGALAAGWNT